MKIRINIYFALALLLCSALGFSNNSKANVFTAESVSSRSQDPSDINFQLVNRLRKSKGLHALKRNRTLDRAAQIRAQELVEYYSHTRPNGTEPYTAMTENGYSYSTAAENIANASGYSEEVIGKTFFESWKDSPGHYRNMINSDVRDVGIAVYLEDGSWYAVQLFGLSSGSESDYDGESDSDDDFIYDDEPESDYLSDDETSQPISASPEKMINQTVSMINKLRKSAKVKSLKRDPLLERAALTRARELAGYWDANRPDDRESQTVVDDIGYNYASIGIMIFQAPQASATLVKDLFESVKAEESNYASMVEGSLEDIGIAFYNHNEMWYIVMLLASKM